MNKTIFVTGETGFIGQHVLPALKGYTIVPFKKFGQDIADESWIEKVPKADIVLHLAGQSIPYLAEEDREKTLLTNVQGTKNVLEYCRKHDAKLIFSSTNVYGAPQKLPVAEDHPLHPQGMYTESKLAAEDLIAQYAQEGLQGATLRLSNVYGPGQRKYLLIPTIISQIPSGVVRLGDPKPKRDYLFIEDAVLAFSKAIDFLSQNDQQYYTFNIGSGVGTSVPDIVSLLQKLSGDFEVHYNENKVPSGVPEIRYDITLAKNVLGWEPHYSLEEGLRLTLEESNTE